IFHISKISDEKITKKCIWVVLSGSDWGDFGISEAVRGGDSSLLWSKSATMQASIWLVLCVRIGCLCLPSLVFLWRAVRGA
ncbi:MAG: hypothetical protein IKY68_06365, partial [Alistipes sp.]|nr:hypothetical protein [Alistipes sp.]